MHRDPQPLAERNKHALQCLCSVQSCCTRDHAALLSWLFAPNFNHVRLIECTPSISQTHTPTRTHLTRGPRHRLCRAKFIGSGRICQHRNPISLERTISIYKVSAPRVSAALRRTCERANTCLRGKSILLRRAPRAILSPPDAVRDSRRGGFIEFRRSMPCSAQYYI